MSTAIPYRAGDSLGRRNLGEVLRAQWDRADKRNMRRIEKQLRRGEKVPCELNGEPITPLGPYPLEDHLDEVWFDSVALSMGDVRRFSARSGHVMEEARALDASDKRDDDEAFDAITAKADRLRRDFLRKALRGFSDLFDGRPPTDDELVVLEDAGYAEHLEGAVLFLHDLGGAEKKTCGAWRQHPTYGIATSADRPCATPDDAPAPSQAPHRPTTPEPSTSTESAPSGSP